MEKANPLQQFSRSGSQSGVASLEEALSPQDASSVKINVFCKACCSQLGYFSSRAATISFLKWTVSVNSNPARTPSIRSVLAAALVATAARTGNSKFLLVPTGQNPDGSTPEGDVILLWALNNDLRFASTRREGPREAVKVLFRSINSKEVERMLDDIKSDAQEMRLPVDAVMELRMTLATSAELLPAKERAFKQWAVGLLEMQDFDV
jgi:ubiquitin-protein ligase E3 D